jgi:hypothetical protein
MTEETQVTESTVVTETPEQVEVVPNKLEQSAMDQGWKPKEEWEGDPDDWRPAKEFVERGELFSKISGQNSEIKELRKALNYLVDHHKKVKETEYSRALTELKNMKKEALVEGDPDKVVEVDEAISTLKEQQKANTESSDDVKSTRQPSPLFIDFVKQNPWYISDAEMKEFADEIGIGYFNTHPGANETETYKHVLSRVQKQFPDRFQRKVTKQTVEGAGSPSSNRNTSAKEYPLTEDERRTMMTFVRSNIMTKDEYIAELKKVKGEA